jgi:hypothetical protein
MPRPDFRRSTQVRRRAAVTMALLALLLLFVAVELQRTISLAASIQHRVNDEQAYRDSKRTQLLNLRVGKDLLGARTGVSPRDEEYDAQIRRSESEAEEVSREVDGLEQEALERQRQVRSMYFCQAFLQVAIVLCAVAMVTGDEWLWYAALLIGLAGAAMRLLQWLH